MIGLYPWAAIATAGKEPVGPPFPPSPIIFPAVGPKVIALDLAFGSDLITRFEEFEFTNPIFVGDQPSLILECGRIMGPGPFTILFTKPDGSQYLANSMFSYDEQSSPVVAPRGRCFPQTYVVYLFSQNEIDQFGLWSVILSASGGFTTAVGKFTVST